MDVQLKGTSKISEQQTAVHRAETKPNGGWSILFSPYQMQDFVTRNGTEHMSSTRNPTSKLKTLAFLSPTLHDIFSPNPILAKYYDARMVHASDTHCHSAILQMAKFDSRKTDKIQIRNYMHNRHPRIGMNSRINKKKKKLHRIEPYVEPGVGGGVAPPSRGQGSAGCFLTRAVVRAVAEQRGRYDGRWARRRGPRRRARM